MSDITTDQQVNSIGPNDISSSPGFVWGVSVWGASNAFWGLLDYPKGGFIGDSLVAAVTVSDFAIQNLSTDGQVATVSIADVQL